MKKSSTATPKTVRPIKTLVSVALLMPLPDEVAVAAVVVVAAPLRDGEGDDGRDEVVNEAEGAAVPLGGAGVGTADGDEIGGERSEHGSVSAHAVPSMLHEHSFLVPPGGPLGPQLLED